MKPYHIFAFAFLLPFIFASSFASSLANSVTQGAWKKSLVRRFEEDALAPLHKQSTKPVKASASPAGDSEDLSDYAPIRNSVGQSGIQYYSFNVNASTGLGEYFEYLVFVTGNICSQPSDPSRSNNDSLTVYYSFNSSMLTSLENSQMASFKNGYVQALAELSVKSTSLVLYMAVQAPQSTNTSDSWSYEIGVSQNDLVYQWDSRPFVDIIDTDHESALIATGNLTLVAGSANVSSLNSSLSSYQLLIFDESQRDYFAALNESWCAVKNGPSLSFSGNYVTSYTTRGGYLRQQFYISGLNASTVYVGYLISDSSDSVESRDINRGGVLYSQFEFETMSTNACKLVYDLSFCDEVAYSVPASSLEEYSTSETLKMLYDNEAQSLFGNFSKALQQIACNTTKDALFSPLGSCNTCRTSYKNWLCAVTVPRCSTRDINGYIHRDANASRNAFIDDTVVPLNDYYEVLPCLNVCQVMTRDCPADFGFTCPQKNSTIRLSYFWDEDGDYATCNFLGAPLIVTSSAAMITAAWKFLIASVSFAIVMV